MRRILLAAAILLLAAAARPARASDKASAEPSKAERRAALKDLRRRFMDPGLRSEEPAALALDGVSFAELDELRDEVEFVHAGRVEAYDDWATYADMVVKVARDVGVEPPESALALYRDRVRPAGLELTAAESRVRSSLLGAIEDMASSKRYLYITGLVDSPQPEFTAPATTKVVFVKGKNGKKRKVVRALRAPELAPPPKAVSVIGQIDWESTDELADVADNNAHSWDRRAGENARKYARRLRRLRKHCYEWVRRDITALGLWDDRLFRGEVAGTRRDPKRSIRAASFALAMAKVQAADSLIARTPLRELNLRVDPIVRGSILVFTQGVCGYDARSGHIEIVTSVLPLRAASYKFHDVKSDCLVRASAQNKVHVYVPLRVPQPAAPAQKS